MPSAHNCVNWSAAALLLCGCAAGPEQKKNTMDAVTYFTEANQVAMANAVERDDVKRIRELAHAGVDVNARGDQGMTFTVWAMGHRRKNALRALLESGADANAPAGGSTPLLELAAKDEDPDYLRLLLAAGGNPNVKNHLGEPLLFTAISEMRWVNMRALVERGADVNAAGNDGATPVMLLAGLNQFEEVMWLLNRGADFKAVSQTGATLAWRVQRARVNAGSPQAGWRERVKAYLEAAGVKFPVPAPKQE